jgi:phage/plasmid-associated DNA primase
MTSHTCHLDIDNDRNRDLLLNCGDDDGEESEAAGVPAAVAIASNCATMTTTQVASTASANVRDDGSAIHPTPLASIEYQEPAFDNELEPFTDVGNAARLALNCGTWLRYVPAWGWLVYGTGAWRRDSGQQMVMEGAKEVLRRMAAEHLGNSPKAEQDAWHRHIRYSFNHVDRVVQSARTVDGIAATIDDFDTNPWLLNTQNLVCDLRTGEALPHAPEHLLRKQANAIFDSEAIAPTWQRFINDIFCGDADLVTISKPNEQW